MPSSVLSPILNKMPSINSVPLAEKELNLISTRRSGKYYPHVHFPDTHLEVKLVAKAILNENSIEWMNIANDDYPKSFSI